MKVAYVVPRYGPRVVGGAEQACRMLAERLAGHTGWPVEILTTTAVDSATWAEEEPPGERLEGGVLVRRFPTAPRSPGFDKLSEELLGAPLRASEADQRRWLEMQGPVSPGLLDAIEATDADVVAFTPYLFHPTACGIARAPGRTVVHPATHDEAPARLPALQSVFTSADGLCFYSDAERRLAERLFGVAAHHQLVLGLGVERGAGDEQAFRRDQGLGDDPYLLCLGRVDDSKGTGQLVRLFAAYKRENPGPLRLLLVGPVVRRPQEHDAVVVTGVVDEQSKWGALQGAVALVSTSRHESFSLVILEAWLAGVPVLVSALCEVTREHVTRSRGGVAFGSYTAFEAAVEILLRDRTARGVLAAQGAAYVERNYRWPELVARYARFLEQVAERPARPRRPAPGD